MRPLDSFDLACPWCGSPVELTVDATAGSAEYVEDCWTCCRPMLIRTQVDPYADEPVLVSVEREGG
jgi:hypothetical protein